MSKLQLDADIVGLHNKLIEFILKVKTYRNIFSTVSDSYIVMPSERSICMIYWVIY